MWQSILCLLLLSGAPQADAVFKKEMAPLQGAVNAAVVATGATVFTDPKATHLDNYGVIVVVEVMLEPPPSPAILFSPKTDTVKVAVAQRYSDLKSRVSELLKQQITKAESIGPNESMAIIVHLVNATRADVPDLPAQLVVSIKKSDPTRVSVKEF